jgi:NADPH:quinone reductase-like Zn-dependent oxidoreductase
MIMKAIRFHEYGDPSVLRHEDVDLPVPATGQVRLRVAGTSFNGVDGNIRAGFMQGPMPLQLPHIPGIDVAGVVDELGDGVTGLTVGDEVVGFLPFTQDGAAAEYVLAPAEALTHAPTTIPLADAAALPIVGVTAWQALFDHAGLRAGQRILVNGAGGAVGGHAVPRTREQVVAQGADEVIDHTSTDVVAAVGQPVDVLLNLAPIDPDTFASLAGIVRDGGVVVSTTVWMPAPHDDDRGVRGIDLYVTSDAEQLAELVARVDRGELTVDVARRVALSELPAVHAAAADGTLTGKIVVVPDVV